MGASDGQAILETLKEEAAVCAELTSLRDEQRRLIDAGEAERLLEVLARKQRAIARIGRLEETLKPVKAGWDERRLAFPAGQRIAIGDAFREVRGLLETLIRKETEDAEALAARRTQAAEELGTFDRKRRLETVYRGADGPAESRFIDRKNA